MPESLKMLDIVLMPRNSCLKTKNCNEEEIETDGIIDDLSQSVLSLKLEKGKQKQLFCIDCTWHFICAFLSTVDRNLSFLAN